MPGCACTVSGRLLYCLRMAYKILMLGPQGSGKGTQATILSKKLRVPALSMGQLLRDEVGTGSELGAEIDRIINKEGKLVPDTMALEVLRRRLSKPDVAEGYVLDGYPRNAAQYSVFAQLDTPTHAVLIDVPFEESMARLLKRAQTEGRVDDTQELIRTRLQIYENETKPILEEYRSQGLLREVDGVGTVEEIARRVSDALGV